MPPALAEATVVIDIARRWIGTPYLHQASRCGVGADCLGLARGIWRALNGGEPFVLPPYTRDWGEVGAREVLLEAAERFLMPVPLAKTAPGCLLLFRMAPRVPAKHCGILAALGPRPTIIHAYEGAGVIEEGLTDSWARRIAHAFRFPLLGTPADDQPEREV